MARSILLIVLLLLSACAPVTTDASSVGLESAGPTVLDDAVAQLHPDVVDAQLTEDDDGTFTVAVTLSSPYDTPERYADAWRVLSLDGEQIGIRELTHDHAAEQPFTRSQGGIVIPDTISEVRVQGRDQSNGWGGADLTVAVPGR